MGGCVAGGDDKIDGDQLHVGGHRGGCPSAVPRTQVQLRPAAADAGDALFDTAVPHRHEDVQDGLFEEVGTRCAETFEQLRGDLGSEPRHTRVDLFGWVEGGLVRCCGSSRVGGRCSRCWLVVAVRGDLAEFALAETIGVVDEKATPEIGDGVCRAAGAGKCFGSGEGRDGASDAVAEAALPGVDRLGPLLVGQPTTSATRS